MKLYTEEQVRDILWKAYSIYFYDEKIEDIFNSYNPIELPSDEEIFAEAVKYNSKSDMTIVRDIVFIEGAKWMREQIQKKIQKQLLSEIMQSDENDGLYDNENK